MGIDATVAERLDRIESRTAIGDLLAGYAYGCDRHDPDRWIEVFSDDAVYDMPHGRFVGREAIRPLFDRIWQGSPETHHWITDHVIAFTGPNVAVGEAHASCYVRNAAGEHRLVAASYDNAYQRADGEWRITRCTLAVHWNRVIDLQGGD